MTGTIVKIVWDRGFAFLTDENGDDRFVHIHVCQQFDQLRPGTVVEFDPASRRRSNPEEPKGRSFQQKNQLRAENVRIVSQPTVA